MAKKRKQQTPEAGVATEASEELTTGKVTEIIAEKAVGPLVELQNTIETVTIEAAKNWDLYLRERADLENARKRHQRDKEEALRFANDRLLKEIIPVLDNLERAIDHTDQDNDDIQGLLEGVNMTINQFRKALENFGVKPINAIGTNFDPNLHQAMGHVESEEQTPNTVVSEFQKGYLLHERLLRPSMVMVAKAPENAAEDPGNPATSK